MKEGGSSLVPIVFIVLFLVGMGFVVDQMFFPKLSIGGPGSNQYSAVGTMKHLREMSAIFRQEDSDRNGIQDFWVADVSGLYRVLQADGRQIAKIEVPVAWADGRPIDPVADYIGSYLEVKETPWPKAGYYFRAMESDGNGIPYKQNTMGDKKTVALNAGKFAFCGYPATYEETGKYIFIVCEDGKIWAKDTGNNTPVLQWPAANPATVGWGNID
ncbi:MAG: hypothetical protein A2Z34_09180 [Planctomycetes bacterium RBG_16_59_8]|nr:MAG: hypothetical protein A2Z34_09180 [Planctomycetes bacterium RBG_16_59_8]